MSATIAEKPEMPDVPGINKLSTHAKERVFQRSHLTPVEVQDMLDKHQFCWARKPKTQDASRYAVVYDALAQSYLVAIVAADSCVVKTVLTVEQFEQSVFELSEAVRLLARLSILEADCQEYEYNKAPVQRKSPGRRSMRTLWRFTVTTAEGESVHFPSLRYSEMISRLKATFRGPRLKFEPSSIVQQPDFYQWFGTMLREHRIEPEDVAALDLHCIDPRGRFTYQIVPMTPYVLYVLAEEVSPPDTTKPPKATAEKLTDVEAPRRQGASRPQYKQATPLFRALFGFTKRRGSSGKRASGCTSYPDSAATLESVVPHYPSSACETDGILSKLENLRFKDASEVAEDASLIQREISSESPREKRARIKAQLEALLGD